MRRRLPVLASVCGAAAALLLFGGRPAHAVTQCMTVDEFNAYMDTQTSAAFEATLTFTVTGVNLDDYFNGKGWLAEFVDTSCPAGLASAALKVYGTSDPLNTAHPPGTLKLEYGSACCATPPCPVERWADPNPGPAVFMVPAQVCNVTLTVNPTLVLYDVQCDGGTVFHAEGDNIDAMPITRAAVLSELSGGHPVNGIATDVQICFDLAGAPVDSQIFAVVEDVTVSADFPTTVYPWDQDLACGLTDGQIYLKFDLRGLAGTAGQATLFVHSGTDPSSNGAGGDLATVADDSWSETTLAWNARPAPASPSIGRIEGVTPDRWYALDVSAAVGDPAVYSFALVPSATDADASHFISKEASATLRPYLQVSVLVVDGDGDGTPAGPDCNDGDAIVHPGAIEACDGVDNDCNGAVDEGCPGTIDAGPPVGGTPDADPGGGLGGGTITGCGCAAGNRPPVGEMLLLGAVLLVGLAGRRHRRR